MNWTQLLFLFRAWLPSWKFFEESGETLTLFVRWGDSEEALQDWILAFQPLERKWSAFFINPEVNFRHLNETLLQQLKNESDQFLQTRDISEFENSAPFKITKELAREQIEKMEPLQDKVFFQFKIAGLLPQQEPTESTDDVIISPLYTWQE